MGKFKEFLVENPDRVSNSIWWKSRDSKTFGYVKGKFFISKETTNHPDFAIELLNKKLVMYSDIMNNNRGEVDRNSFKYPGRLWTDSKIISFWVMPSKNDFDKLIEDLKKNGIKIDETWKIDIEDGPVNSLVPITNYTDKYKKIQVKDVEHTLPPELKNKALKNKGVTPGYVMKANRLPKNMSYAEFYHLTKSESLEENHEIERLEKLMKNKIITKQQAIETVTKFLVGFSLRREFGETMESYFNRNPKEKKNHDDYLAFKERLLKEDLPTTTTPSSPETGRHEVKMGKVSKRSEEKEKLKKKIKKKLQEEWKDKLKGGYGDKSDPDDVDPKELEMGIKHEMEHTNDRHIATEIALDHLKEDPKYYTNLKKKGLD